MSNKEYRTAEVFERSKTMFFTSTFCGSLFCGSAVHILKDLIADGVQPSSSAISRRLFKRLLKRKETCWVRRPCFV
jgi:hypothetical protein